MNSFHSWLITTGIYLLVCVAQNMRYRASLKRVMNTIDEHFKARRAAFELEMKTAQPIALARDKEGVVRCPHCLKSLQADHAYAPEGQG